MFNDLFGYIKDLAYLITVIVAVIMMIKALREYIINVRMKKMEILSKYR